MRKCFLFLALLNIAGKVHTQKMYDIINVTRGNIDSLHQLLTKEKTDTGKATLFRLLANSYILINKDSTFWYFQQALTKYRELKDVKAESDVSAIMAWRYGDFGNYPQALTMALHSLRLAEREKDTSLLFTTTRAVRNAYAAMNDHATAIEYARKIKVLVHSGFFKQKDLNQLSLTGYQIAMTHGFEKLNQLDSAYHYAQLSYKTALALNGLSVIALTTVNLGNTYLKMGSHDSAFANYRRCIPAAVNSGRDDVLAEANLGIARLFAQSGKMDSALFYGRFSLHRYQQWQRPEGEMQVASFLTEVFSRLNQTDSAFKYQTIALRLNDSLYNQEQTKQVYNIRFNEELRQQQIELEKKEVQQQYVNRIRVFGLVAGLVIVMIIAGILYRNNRQKQKTNAILQQQKAETEKQKEKTEKALEVLKATQAQLIQSEKMASLGELTAGIAHEIQNPLNFVNNFSAVNSELVSELRQEARAGNIDEVLSLATAIEENEAKISYHGRRADVIVKGMLHHSRGVIGERRPTDINQLVEEHLRLAYHGYRAKEATFVANVTTYYDPSTGKVDVVPQEIGRVLLNLFNNAFYAVNERKKQLNGTFEPTVSVSTKKQSNHIIITVQDNGTGIPDKVLSKIYQPFFTTKPTGEGTGLGLSLSYDIITKGHGGEMKVESKEGEGTEFVIQLPLREPGQTSRS